MKSRRGRSLCRKTEMAVACFTMAHNESAFLPIWARYYASAFGPENLTVIDHGSDDGSIDCLPRGIGVIHLPRTVFDEYPRTALINSVKDGLLGFYDAVMYTDCDEIIVPDPEIYKNGLGEYCKIFATLVAPTGLNIFQVIHEEGAIKLDRPILGQRRYCQFASVLCKPIIAKSKVTWSPGFHYADRKPHFAKDLYLFHLKAIDQGLSLKRLKYTRDMEWSETNLSRNIGGHQRLTDIDHLKQVYAAPLRAAPRETNDLAFNYDLEMDQIEAETNKDGQYFRHVPFYGKTAIVPERFYGLV